MSIPPFFTVQQIADRVGGEVAGDASRPITGVEQIEQARPGHLTFIGSQRYARLWPASRASAALVSLGMKDEVPSREETAIILVKNADLAMAKVLEMFTPPLPVGGMGEGDGGQETEDSENIQSPRTPVRGSAQTFIHPTAIIDPTARIGAGVRIGAHCIIGPRVTLGDRTILYPQVTILDDSTLGSDCLLWPGIVIRERCTLGHRCIIHPNVTIGSDGFGYRPGDDGKSLVKVPQIGAVEIGSDVEIGAGSCIDRGKFSATIIGDGCKIDNLVQIGHNCRLGRCVIVAGQAGIAGSTTIGDGAMIGGRAGIADHVHIAAGGIVGAAAGVMRDVEVNQRVMGIPAKDSRTFFKEQAALSKLPEMLKQMRKNDPNRETPPV